MKFALLLMLPIAAQAQLSLFTFNGTTETPVGATYSYGNIATAASSAVRFRIFNTGNSGVEVYAPVVNGEGFAITAINGTPPVTIPPVSSTINFFEFSVTFNAAGQAAGTHSASLQISGPAISTMGVLLLATVPGTSSAPGQPPAVTILNGAGCSASSSTSIAFAAVNIGSQGLCNFTLTNPNSFGITVSSIAVSGDPAFSVGQAPQLPVTLAANSSTSFTLVIKPVCGQANYSGTLTITSSYYSNSFGVRGNGLTPPLPTPSLVFDSQTFSSAQQHTVSMTLPSAAACGANGYLNLAFTPASSQPNDTTIVFMSGSTRTLPFTVAPGSSQVLINGGASATFATGSTAGTISFSLSGVTAAGNLPNPTFMIAPAAIVIDSATASNQAPGQLNITVVGYDNTYSAGQMTFTFFDGNNQAVGQPVSANFTSNFQGFYAGQQMGSTFLMQVSFPVLGSCVPAANTTCQPNQVIASVQATFTNSAGQTQTGTLTFQ